MRRREAQAAAPIRGVHGAREALRSSPERVRRLLVSRDRDDARVSELVQLARARGIPVYRESAAVLDRLARGERHQGVIAEVTALSWVDLEDLLASAPAPAFLLGLDQIEDPRNLGALVRTAESAGVHGVVVPHRRGAPPSEAAVVASAGALLHARMARVTNLSTALERVKKAGIWVVGVTPGAPSAWYELDYTVPVLIVVGSEGRGLRRLVAESCDALVSLPQLGRVESLNVSVAAGAVLYEVVRQRRLGRPRE